MTVKQWLSRNARAKPVHYTDIAEALGRDASSVQASLSIEGAQAEANGRPAYFVRIAPGLYRYNDLCEGAVDEAAIDEALRSRARQFNNSTRAEMIRLIARLDVNAFEKLAKIVLINCRAYSDENDPDEKQRLVVRDRRNSTIEMTTAWRDDGGCSPVVVYAKKCSLDEEIGVETIRELRGSLPRYGANQGVLISNGIVTEEAKYEAVGFSKSGLKVTIPPIHLMDKEIMLDILFESRTGIRSRSVDVFLIDKEFFGDLSDK